MQNYKLGDYKGSRKYHLALDSLIFCYKTNKTSTRFLEKVLLIGSMDQISQSKFASALCPKCASLAAKAGA